MSTCPAKLALGLDPGVDTGLPIKDMRHSSRCRIEHEAWTENMRKMPQVRACSEEVGYRSSVKKYAY
jgi:hypothetical protein